MSAMTTFTRGMRLTDYATLDLTVEGLASGGMGLVVWGPNAARSGRITALKLLRPDRLAEAAARSPEARAASKRQFEAEALVWCHLWPHQSVITANGLTRLPGLGDLPVLTLEYAPNGSLRRQLQLAQQQRRPLPLRAALAWAIHIAAALTHIHAGDAAHERPEPLVHCDLKPENTLIDEHGWAQLTDLGLTRAYATLEALGVQTAQELRGGSETPETTKTTEPKLAEIARLRAVLQQAGALPALEADHTALLATRTLRIPPTQSLPHRAGIGEGIGSRGPVAGSLPYMAPEQWLGLDATTPATDLYAFGVLLFELFAGYAAPFPFPRDPSPYLTHALYAQALATGNDPLILAWHAAHTRQSLPAEATEVTAVAVHRLTDAEQQAAALASGPCAELVARGESARANECLEQVAALVEVCLALDPAERPNAEAVMQRLNALAQHPCGLDPIPVPEALPATPHSEGAFWSNLSLTYTRLGRHEEAIATQRRALQYSATDPITWLNLGAALNGWGRSERDKGARLQSAGQAVSAERSLAQARRRNEEALDAFQQAQRFLTPEVIAEYPALPGALAANEANALATLERYAEAVAADERALAHNPEKHDTRYNLASHLARWSQEAGATGAERLARLERAQRELAQLLATAPQMGGARDLANRIARALADPAHRFQG